MMNTKTTVLALGCALALSACGNHSSSSEAPGAAPATTATVPAAPAIPPAAAPATSSPAMAATAGMAMGAAAPAANGKPTAVVKDCATEIEASDSIQYNVSSIVVPASCKDFKITLKHTGTLPVTSMGHDVVITKASDEKAVDAAGSAAGAADGYVKPDDPKVIAHTKLIGGGETTSVSFPVSKIQGDGPYEFFCSFPGHAALMNGSISVQ